jgi:hypothetical protein
MREPDEIIQHDNAPGELERRGLVDRCCDAFADDVDVRELIGLVWDAWMESDIAGPLDDKVSRFVNKFLSKH